MSALSGSSRLLAVHKKSVVEQGFFHEFAFDNTCLKHSTNFEAVENVRSSNVVEFEFELRHIPNLVSIHYQCLFLWPGTVATVSGSVKATHVTNCH